METMKPWADVRPSAGLARTYRQLGFWRDVTPAADLRRWARETPDAIAISAHTAARGTQRMTYREYADQVERVTAVLAELGIGPGDVVALQLPNWWQLNAVVLACARLGAIAAPFVTAVRARELELMLSRLAPTAYVTAKVWDGYEHAAVLASIADRLPAIKHRIIVGGHAGTGEIDLDRRIEQAPAATRRVDDSAEDPDRVSVVLFTSGTTGVPKAALHSFNTFYASYRITAMRAGLSSRDVLFTPHNIGHVIGLHMANMLPLYLGAQVFLSDTWDPEASADLLAEHGATLLMAAPVFVEAIAGSARRHSSRLPRLRHVYATGTTIPASLVAAVSEDLGRVLETGWGMTETGGAFLTSADEDPPDWAALSIGTPFACAELDLRSGEPEEEVSPRNPGRLFVRGANVCLATMPRDGGQVTVLADGDDGAWYDTGDLAVPDGRGGLRMVGRAADRIGARAIIPAADVEDALRGHPDIDDAALVGYGPVNELPCAVVVSRVPLTLDQVRSYLDGIGMTADYQPQRLEVVGRLPRNSTGKVDKHSLRIWLAG
jgi:cyclohexanecarboxylate-CoA ligase